jgi:hypothetical protein
MNEPPSAGDRAPPHPSKITAWLDCAHSLTLRHQVDACVITEPDLHFGSFARLVLSKGLEQRAGVPRALPGGWTIGLRGAGARSGRVLRLNLAISRARCLAYLVCTEDLVNSRARDVEEMRLISTLCSFIEYAEGG